MIETVIKDLGIDYLPGEYSKSNSYIIDLQNDAEFGKMYTLLDNSYEVEQEEDTVLLTVHNA